MIDKLRRFTSCVEIAHHIPGRIRLRLDLDSVPPLDAEAESLLARMRDFKEAIGQAPGVHSIRVNPLALSCTIEYDHGAIPFGAWQDFLVGARSEDAAVLHRIIVDKYAELTGA